MNKKDLVLEIKKRALLKVSQSLINPKPSPYKFDPDASKKEKSSAPGSFGGELSESPADYKPSKKVKGPAPDTFGAEPSKSKDDSSAYKRPSESYKPVYVAPQSTSVWKLQETIQAFGKVVSDNKSKIDFNDFVVEQYVAPAGGTEYTVDETHVKPTDKNPVAAVEMVNVIADLGRIGASTGKAVKGEWVVDGKWGPKTNHALQSCVALAQSLIQLVKDFQTKNKYKFNASSAAKLQSLVPDVEPAQGAESLASQLIPLINDLSAFYTQYKADVLNNPQYRPYIEQSAPLFKVKSTKKDPGALPAKYKDPKSYGTRVIRNVVLPTKSGNKNFEYITLSSFDSLSNLKSFMSSKLGYTDQDISNPEILKAVFTAIKQHVDNEFQKIDVVRTPEDRLDSSTETKGDPSLAYTSTPGYGKSLPTSISDTSKKSFDGTRSADDITNK